MKRIIRRISGRIHANSFGTLNESNRVEWLEKTLKKIPEGGRILDAGAGEQQFKRFCTHLNYVAQDFAEYKPEEKEAGLQMEKWDYTGLDIVSDIASIPEPDKSFDAIMCTEVFEHIINPKEAIKEFARLLKPNGYLIITAPFCSLTHFAPYHFYSGFNRYFYEQTLPQNNFKILELIPNGNFFEYLAQELHRLETVNKKYSKYELTRKDKTTVSNTLALLEKISSQETGSSELLNHGWHVFAQRL